MKQRITLSIAFVVSIASMSVLFATTTHAQQTSIKARFDTGVLRLAPQEILRLTVALGDFTGDGAVDAADYVLFRRTEYGQETCGNNGICKLVVTLQTTTNPIMLSAGEAISSANMGGGLDWVRVIALTNRRNVRVTATITNIITGETTSHIIVANTDGDIH